MSLDELRKQETELWSEMQEAEKVVSAIRSKWFPVFQELRKAEVRAEIATNIERIPNGDAEKLFARAA